MISVKKYIETNKDRFIEELFSLIRIPSISAKHEHKPDMEACAKRWTELLLAAGADKAVVMQTEGNPVVYGEKMVSPEAQTVLVYSHYDVMPAEPFDQWKSRPFEPEIRDGRIWARGADDDKGQAMMQVKGFETALNLDLLKCNVKFIFEGEEEIGSPSLEAFCRTHKELLKADVILVSDTSMVSAETPSLTTGLRGLAYWEIEVTGPNRDLHSGHFGGAVANPINVLCKLMADITDADGRITIPGFYDDVEDVSPAEREMIAQIPFDEAKYKAAIGVDELFGEKGYSTLDASFIISICPVCGIVGTIFSGVISDKLFGGRRNVPALIFGLMNVLALSLFLLVPGVHFWIDVLAMVLFGLGIGVLICFLGGLMAVDIAPRNASGAALGVVGIASYIGAGLQDVMSGVLIEGQKTVQNGVDVYDFTYINWFWIGAALLSVFFALLVWNAKSKESD